MRPALPPVVSETAWQEARDALLLQEKAHMRAGDALAAQRRRLPVVEFAGDFAFDGPSGSVSLLDLFEGRSQLIVYSFMLGPGAREPCGGCSMFVDNLPHLSHLRARDTNLVLVSRAPLAEIEPVRERMGWTLPWYSEEAGAFQAQVGAYVDGRDTFRFTVFLRDGDRVFKTWATAGRGVEPLGTVWALLDSTPYGRREEWEDSPAGWPQTPPYQWWDLHPDYPAEVRVPAAHAHSG